MDRRERLEDPEESLRMAMDAAQAQIWTALPGMVTEVDLTRQTVSVQPTIQGVVGDKEGNEQQVNMPVLVDVPLMFPRAGGFAITFPVKPGDEVLVVFAARCIDSWWQSGGIGAPAETRMHDLSDGFAILAPTSQPKKLSAVQSDGVEMRTESRDTYIRLTDGTIYIKGNIVHEGDMERKGDSVHNGKTTENGLLTYTQGMRGSGGTGAAAVITGDVVANGISLSTHLHGGVQPGGGDTSAPK